MTLTVASLPRTFDESAFETFLATRGEPAWVTDRRRQAFALLQERFEAELDPEEWRRVNLRLFRPEEFAVKPAGSCGAGFDTNLQRAADFAGRVIHCDGGIQASELA